MGDIIIQEELASKHSLASDLGEEVAHPDHLLLVDWLGQQEEDRDAIY